MKHFILMGDIIGSTGKNPPGLMRDFVKTVSFANRKYAKRILSPLTITLGDEFQGVVKDAAASADVIFAIEEFIIQNRFGFKLRYVLNQGEIKTRINTKKSYKMLGDGLTEARRQLVGMKKSNDRFHYFLQDADKAFVVNRIFRIVKNVVDKWDVAKNHEIISTFINHGDYKIVAEKLDKTRSLMWKREKTLNMESYFAAKEILNAVLKG